MGEGEREKQEEGTIENWTPVDRGKKCKAKIYIKKCCNKIPFKRWWKDLCIH